MEERKTGTAAAISRRLERRPGMRALAAGAGAGLVVDLSLLPLDTIKTRLQSKAGFIQAGGLRRLWAGAPSVAIGSAPGAALFFATYETAKRTLNPILPSPHASHALAASLGEIAACLVRVPTEVIKQNAQIYPRRSVWYIYKLTRSSLGFAGFYRGYWSTILREIPFSFIQFPIWEALKLALAQQQDRLANPLESAGCGSVAGMIAASLTTPLDVAKTRIMTAHLQSKQSGNVYRVLGQIVREEGWPAVWSGIVPRTVWMGLGGFIFFGAYELMQRLVSPWGVYKAEETKVYVGNFKVRFREWVMDHMGDQTMDEERMPYDQVVAEGEAELAKRAKLYEEEQRLWKEWEAQEPGPIIREKRY